MSLLDIQEVQDICEHCALHARKWSGFICKRASRYNTITLGLLKKEERRRMPNHDFFYFSQSIQYYARCMLFCLMKGIHVILIMPAGLLLYAHA